MSIQLRTFAILQYYLDYKIFEMLSRTKWTQQEDEYLKIAANAENKKNWVKISKLLNAKFEGKQWTSKQCRERFINHCSLQEKYQSFKEWTPEEIKSMLQLFEVWGPKWTIIASQLAGRTENSIKNKFYSGLRKFVRKLNFITKRFFKKYKKELKYSSILRVLEASRSLFLTDEELIKQSEERRHEIIGLMMTNFLNVTDEEVAKLTEDINKFNLHTRSFRCKKIPSLLSQDEIKQRTSQSVNKQLSKGGLEQSDVSLEGKDRASRSTGVRAEGDREDNHSNMASDIGYLKSPAFSINFNEELIDYDLQFDQCMRSGEDLECLNELEINQSPLRITYLL